MRIKAETDRKISFVEICEDIVILLVEFFNVSRYIVVIILFALAAGHEHGAEQNGNDNYRKY